LDTPLLRERNQKFLGLLLYDEIIYIIEIMYKKFLLVNSLGKEVLKAAKSYYRGGGKTIKQMMEAQPSKNIKAQSRDAAKSDIKFFIKSNIKKPRGRK
tara:strand:+ start:1062 stop:1355 length:294 start_codon:yes stop_codon:yes gene_type:complete